jgi:hypothetical protein
MLKKPPPPGGPHRHRHSLSALGAAASETTLASALALIVPEPEDAAFVARCILGEGPAHHRAASWALVSMAAELARRLGAAASPSQGEDSVPVALRLPPHLRSGDDGVFPLAMPLAPLRAVLAGERDVEAIADALVDGPPHHALANAALVAIFDRISRRLGELEAERE